MELTNLISVAFYFISTFLGMFIQGETILIKGACEYKVPTLGFINIWTPLPLNVSFICFLISVLSVISLYFNCEVRLEEQRASTEDYKLLARQYSGIKEPTERRTRLS